MNKMWMINELSHAGPEHLDAEYVAGYDQKAQTDPAPDVEQLRRFGLSPNSTVIDFGAGTGVFVTAVAPHCRAVIAVEPSPAMRTQMQHAVEQRDITNVTIVDGGFLSYEHRVDPVDFVFTRNALHHLPDFWKAQALCRMHSALAPGGIMLLRDLIFDFEPQETDVKLREWMAGAVDDPAVGWTAAELAEHVREEYSTFRWLFEPLLQHTGFDILESAYQRRAYATYICRAQ